MEALEPLVFVRRDNKAEYDDAPCGCIIRFRGDQVRVHPCLDHSGAGFIQTIDHVKYISFAEVEDGETISKTIGEVLAQYPGTIVKEITPLPYLGRLSGILITLQTPVR